MRLLSNSRTGTGMEDTAIAGLNQQDLVLISDPNRVPTSIAADAAAAAVVAAAASSANSGRGYFGHEYQNAELLDLNLEWGSIPDAREYIYEYARRNGFLALTTATTRDKRHCVFSCNKKGACKSRSKGYRNRRSLKCGCKWHVNVWIRSAADEPARYGITSCYLKHNHPPMPLDEIEKATVRRKRLLETKVQQQEEEKQQNEEPSQELNSIEMIHQSIDAIIRLSSAPTRRRSVLDTLALKLQTLVQETENAIQEKRKPARKVLPRPRKCRKCDTEGHDSRACPEL